MTVIAELDLLNALVSAEEILDEPSGRQATILAKQIAEECAADVQIVQLAEAVRVSKGEERVTAATSLLNYLKEQMSQFGPKVTSSLPVVR